MAHTSDNYTRGIYVNINNSTRTHAHTVPLTDMRIQAATSSAWCGNISREYIVASLLLMTQLRPSPSHPSTARHPGDVTEGAEGSYFTLLLLLLFAVDGSARRILMALLHYRAHPPAPSL